MRRTIILVLLATALAGCGGEDDDDGSNYAEPRAPEEGRELPLPSGEPQASPDPIASLHAEPKP